MESLSPCFFSSSLPSFFLSSFFHSLSFFSDSSINSYHTLSPHQRRSWWLGLEKEKACAVVLQRLITQCCRVRKTIISYTILHTEWPAGGRNCGRSPGETFHGVCSACAETPGASQKASVCLNPVGQRGTREGRNKGEHSKLRTSRVSQHRGTWQVSQN